MIGEGKTRGQAAILNIEAAHNQNTAAIRVSQTGCNSKVVYYYLHYQYEITRKLGSGNNQKALNKARVSNMLYPLFSIEEQNELTIKIEEQLSILTNIESDINNNLQRSEALRQSILKKPSPASWWRKTPAMNPPSELLQRIQAQKAELAVQAKAAKAASKKKTVSRKKAGAQKRVIQ